MLFQPAILALLFASAVTVAMLLGAAPFAVDVFRHWDITSGSERQLQLERRTYLMSTLVAFIMATELLALLLFVFNADKMASMFVGAMCAVGALNARRVWFPSADRADGGVLPRRHVAGNQPCGHPGSDYPWCASSTRSC